MWNLLYSRTAILFMKILASRGSAAPGTLISKKRKIGSWNHQSFITSRFLFLLLVFPSPLFTQRCVQGVATHTPPPPGPHGRLELSLLQL